MSSADIPSTPTGGRCGDCTTCLGRYVYDDVALADVVYGDDGGATDPQPPHCRCASAAATADQFVIAATMTAEEMRAILTDVVAAYSRRVTTGASVDLVSTTRRTLAAIATDAGRATGLTAPHAGRSVEAHADWLADHAHQLLACRAVDVSDTRDLSCLWVQWHALEAAPPPPPAIVHGELARRACGLIHDEDVAA